MRRVPDGYFTGTGRHTFMPTRHTGGAWSQSEQHISPMGVLPLQGVDVHVEVIRPGRTVELPVGQAIETLTVRPLS